MLSPHQLALHLGCDVITPHGKAKLLSVDISGKTTVCFEGDRRDSFHFWINDLIPLLRTINQLTDEERKHVACLYYPVESQFHQPYIGQLVVEKNLPLHILVYLASVGVDVQGLIAWDYAQGITIQG